MRREAGGALSLGAACLAALALSGCGGAAPAAKPAAAAAPPEEVIDEESAAKLMKACYAEGQAIACHALAMFFEEGQLGYRKDPKAADELFQLSWALIHARCERGEAEQCALGGMMLAIGILKMAPGDPRLPRVAARAVPMLERACKGGEGAACDSLGGIHADGLGVPPDPKRALLFFEKGCAAGDPGSCTSLGNNRWEVQDGQGAATAYAKACELGAAHEQARRAEKIPDPPERLRSKGPPRWAQSCAMAGYQLATGDGVDEDPAASAPLLEKGCEGGAWNACTALGLIHWKGRTGAADAARAAALLHRACEGGDAHGCGSLGYLYEHGEGVPKDSARALALYRQSCALGDERGCREVHRLGKPNRMILTAPRW